jgi:hypothetical protein
VDLLVRTPEKVRERLAMGDDFMRKSLSKGRLSMKPMTAEWISKAEGDCDLKGWIMTVYRNGGEMR